MGRNSPATIRLEKTAKTTDTIRFTRAFMLLEYIRLSVSANLPPRNRLVVEISNGDDRSLQLKLPEFPCRKILIRWSPCLLCGFLAFTDFAGAGEQSVWADQISGTTSVSGVGSLRYTVGYDSVGYDHFRSEITVEWQDDGDRTQTIYEGIYDKPPAKVWGNLGHLCVSMEACARYEDACTTHVMAYRYDNAAKSFDEIQGGDRICRR